MQYDPYNNNTFWYLQSCSFSPDSIHRERRIGPKKKDRHRDRTRDPIAIEGDSGFRCSLKRSTAIQCAIPAFSIVKKKKTLAVKGLIDIVRYKQVRRGYRTFLFFFYARFRYDLSIRWDNFPTAARIIISLAYARSANSSALAGAARRGAATKSRF